MLRLLFLNRHLNRIWTSCGPLSSIQTVKRASLADCKLETETRNFFIVSYTLSFDADNCRVRPTSGLSQCLKTIFNSEWKWISEFTMPEHDASTGSACSMEFLICVYVCVCMRWESETADFHIYIKWVARWKGYTRLVVIDFRMESLVKNPREFRESIPICRLIYE